MACWWRAKGGGRHRRQLWVLLPLSTYMVRSSPHDEDAACVGSVATAAAVSVDKTHRADGATSHSAETTLVCLGFHSPCTDQLCSWVEFFGHSNDSLLSFSFHML